MRVLLRACYRAQAGDGDVVVEAKKTSMPFVARRYVSAMPLTAMRQSRCRCGGGACEERKWEVEV